VLKPEWQMLRTPSDPWLKVGNDALVFHPRAQGLESKGQPSFLGYRIQHARCIITLRTQLPRDFSSSNGLALFYDETHYLYLGLKLGANAHSVFVEKADGDAPELLSADILFSEPGNRLTLRAILDASQCEFQYSFGEVNWTTIAIVDATNLTTARAGGFVGTMTGPFARQE
jgi:alpha-N-arabinofuranosidase